MLKDALEQLKGYIQTPPTINNQWYKSEYKFDKKQSNIVYCPQIYEYNANKKIKKKNTLFSVSWNIEHGKKLTQIIEDLIKLDSKKQIDIITLQEVDLYTKYSNYKNCVKEIAQELGFSAVYSTAFFYLDSKGKPQFHQDMPSVTGNAILTRLPIENSPKILRLAPQYDFSSDAVPRGGNRIALSIPQKFNDKNGNVITTHLELKTTPFRRNLQIQDIYNNLCKRKEIFLIQGDFNTLFGKIEPIHSWLKTEMFENSTGNISTINKKFPQNLLKLDHIYTKSNWKIISSGVIKNIKSSDHLPIYAHYLMHN